MLPCEIWKASWIQRWANDLKAPIAVFRIANVVIVALIVIAEMMAIY